MAKNSKYSNRVSGPNLEIADVFKLCYAPRSSRRRNRPIFALDPYTKNVVVFREQSENDDAESACHVESDESYYNVNDNIQAEKEVVVDHNDEIVKKVDLMLAKFKYENPNVFEQLMEDSDFAENFHNDQYLPAIENYKRFIKDPEGSGIEDPNSEKYESFQQEDGTIVSIPMHPHPIIFPFEIQKREQEKRIRDQRLEELKIQAEELKDFNNSLNEYVRQQYMLTDMFRIDKMKENAEWLKKFRNINVPK